MKQKFKEMQTHAQDQTNMQHDFTRPASVEKSTSKKQDDYIDFEEVK